MLTETSVGLVSQTRRSSGPTLRRDSMRARQVRSGSSALLRRRGAGVISVIYFLAFEGIWLGLTLVFTCVTLNIVTPFADVLSFSTAH